LFRKQITKQHHFVNFQNVKIPKYTFCREFIAGYILKFRAINFTLFIPTSVATNVSHPCHVGMRY